MGRAVGPLLGIRARCFECMRRRFLLHSPKAQSPRGLERAIRSSIVMPPIKCVDSVLGLGSGGSWEGCGDRCWVSGLGILSVCVDGSYCIPPRHSLPRGFERAIMSSIVMPPIKCANSVLGLGLCGSWEGLWGPLLGIRARCFECMRRRF